MITAVVLTKNEERNIKDCILSLNWCDEVLVIDTGSTDKTREIAKKLEAKVFVHNFENNFSKLRNSAFQYARNDWVLFLDADERISESLAFEINSLVTHNLENYIGFFIPRIDVLWGKQLKYGESKKLFVRLGKKKAGEWKGTVHEDWKIKGKIGKLKNAILHYPHQTISEFLHEINFYTNLRSQELYAKKVKSSFFSILFYPTAKFIENYVIRMGLLDGVAGLIVVIMMSFHSFLVRGKLFFLQNKN